MCPALAAILLIGCANGDIAREAAEPARAPSDDSDVVDDSDVISPSDDSDVVSPRDEPATRPNPGSPPPSDRPPPEPDGPAEPLMSDVHDDAPLEPGQPVEVELESSHLTTLQADLDAISGWDGQRLMSEYPVSFESDLGFEPLTAINYDLVQASSLALTAEEEATYAKNGFVISEGVASPTFSYAYHTVYGEDLPVFITADSVLDALHRSYDDILAELELEFIIGTFSEYLKGMRERVAAASMAEQTRKDADFFLAVAASLLEAQPLAPSFEGAYDPADLQAFFDAAMAAEGEEGVELFGASRKIDFSQFKPRGHYTDSELLGRYFRAMMWMGRIDLRMLETTPNGSRVLHRRQVQTTLALAELMDDAMWQHWRHIDAIVTAFVGEHDYMNLTEVQGLADALGISSAAELDSLSDEAIAQAIIDGHFGEQRIASHIMRKQTGGAAGTFPLNASFALFGQRYVVDSHVFSNVVYDRVPDRVVPNPLDAAFAALGNNHAALLLQEEFNAFTYEDELAKTRVLVDSTPEAGWQGSLYTAWLDALRTLSARDVPAGAAAEGAGNDDGGLISVARTEAWGRRLLNTQLGSWSQLRHDTLLYAKQSYTASDACSFPDAYVDPYPEFWAKLLQLADQGVSLLDALDLGGVETIGRATDYFRRFGEIVSVLHEMSELQLAGLPHTPEHIDFANDIIRIANGGSGPPTVEGWYHQLLFHPWEFSDVDWIVADVHTDIGGDLPVPRPTTVLHVGTEQPRLMTVAVETCDGPRAYVGPVYSYKETLVEGYRRLTDKEWQAMVYDGSLPDDPPWMKPIVGGGR